MFNFFIDCILLFLLFYALVSISEKLTDFAFKRQQCKISYAVIKPIDSEQFEYDLRTAASFCQRNGFPLVVVDSGLSDDAKYILDALSGEFSNIVFVSCENFASAPFNQKS